MLGGHRAGKLGHGRVPKLNRRNRMAGVSLKPEGVAWVSAVGSCKDCWLPWVFHVGPTLPLARWTRPPWECDF